MITEKKELVRSKMPLAAIDGQPLMRKAGDALHKRPPSERGRTSGNDLASFGRMNAISSLADDEELAGFERRRHAVAVDAEENKKRSRLGAHALEVVASSLEP